MNQQLRNMVLAGLLTLPGGLLSQEPTPPPGPVPAPRVRVRTRVGEPFNVFAFTGSHGRIGVLVNLKVNADSDKLGARIDGVTPGGPAAKAGLKVGDIITRFNGTSLANLGPSDEDDSRPGMKLIELAHDLDPGDSVQVEYRRGSDTKKATLVAEELSYSYSGDTRVPPMGGMGEWMPPGDMHDMMPEMAGREFNFCFGEGWCNLDLVRLNSDLGEYFGTQEGVLVVKAPNDSSLQLKGGDVIVSIGGRKVSTPEHAMRILQSYEPGESVSIDIMRHQRRTTVTWKVPERGDHWFRTRPDRGHREHGEPSVFKIRPRLGRDMVRVRRQSRLI